MNVRRRGFTLIEILVTVGIILVLVGIAVYGVSKVGDASKGRAAGATLGNLRGMITDLETGAGLKGRQPADIWYDGARQVSTATNPVEVWNDADPQAAGNQPALAPAGSVSKAVAGGGTPARYLADGVANTQRVMQLLLAVPNNKRALGQLPPEQLLEKVPGDVTVPPTKITIDAQRNFNPTVVLDPWQNPIIFVPGSGLCGGPSGGTAETDPSMWVGGPPKFRDAATSAKQVVAVVTTPATQTGPIRSPDGRPFWASAGPDGDFRTGDDNVYSFQQ